MRTITNLGGDLNRDITNGADLNILEADLPLNIVEDPSGESNDTINLGGLSSYGQSGQVMKVNANADGLEWADDNNTTYSAGTNVTIAAQNVIASDQKTTLTFNESQKLRGTGSLTNIRDIAFVDGNNDIIFGDVQNNCGFVVANGIFFYGDGTPLISNTRLFSSSGLNNTGSINNFSGNINLTNDNKIRFNNDDLNSIGSRGVPLAGVELKGFENVLLTTSVTNKPSLNVGQTAIKCKGKISGEFLTGSTERDLLEVLTDNSIQLGDASCGLSVKGDTVLITTDVTGEPSINVGQTAIKCKGKISGEFLTGSTERELLQVLTNNSIQLGDASCGLSVKGDSVLITTDVTGEPSINVGQTAIKCKGKLSGEFVTGTTERELLQVLTNNSIQLGDAGCELIVKATTTTFGSGNPLEIFGYIKFKNAVTSSYIVGSTGNALVSINTAGSLINIFGNGVDKTTVKGNGIDFEGATSSFNGHIQMVREKYLYFDVGLASNNNWIKATDEDGQDGLRIQGSADVLITTETYSGKIFLNGNTLAISANLTTFDNDITTTFSDLTIDGDFTGSDCDISIDGDVKVALLSLINLDRANTTTIFNYMRANPAITLTGGAFTTGGTEIYGYTAVKLAQTFNPTVNLAEFWISGANCRVSATTFNYPTGGGSGSDDRIKFNEVPVQFDCLALINSLQVEVYDKHFIEDRDRMMDREIGIIAQDTYNKIKNQVDSATADLFVSEIDYSIPSNFKSNGDIVENQMKRVIHNDMVTGETTETIEENILAVSYIRFISVLIKSQQQQQEQIDRQQAQIDKQQAQIEMLLKKFNMLS
jgi:uncharacterized pyridoxamine 5'-phosphate oxidase family protein